MDDTSSLRSCSDYHASTCGYLCLHDEIRTAFLLRHGQTVDLLDAKGRRPLHWACRRMSSRCSQSPLAEWSRNRHISLSKGEFNPRSTKKYFPWYVKLLLEKKSSLLRQNENHGGRFLGREISTPRILADTLFPKTLNTHRQVVKIHWDLCLQTGIGGQLNIIIRDD